MSHRARGSGLGILYLHADRSILMPIVRVLTLPNNIALFIEVGSPHVFLVAVAGLLLSVASRRVVTSVIALAWQPI